MQTHQRNYQRILRLRQDSAALDAQIRDTLSSLAATRRDVKTTTTTPVMGNNGAPQYRFTYAELLGYARRISGTTLPPPGTSNGLDQQQQLSQPQQQVAPPSQQPPMAAESQPSGQVTQASTPGGDTIMNGGTQTQTPVGTQPPTPLSQQLQVSEFPTQVTTTTTSFHSLPEHFALNPMAGVVFVPWPTEEQIRMGNLANNQILAEEGIDIKGYDPAKEEERKKLEEEERKAVEEGEKRKREERERKVNEMMEKSRREREQTMRRESTTRPTGEKKQFQFTSIDDMDDDDD